MLGVCLWLSSSWLNWAFSLAQTVCELRPIFFVSLQYVYKFDCKHLMIHLISKEASTRVELFSGLTAAE